GRCLLLGGGNALGDGDAQFFGQCTGLGGHDGMRQNSFDPGAASRMLLTDRVGTDELLHERTWREGAPPAACRLAARAARSGSRVAGRRAEMRNIGPLKPHSRNSASARSGSASGRSVLVITAITRLPT